MIHVQRTWEYSVSPAMKGSEKGDRGREQTMNDDDVRLHTGGGICWRGAMELPEGGKEKEGVKQLELWTY